jgi:serine/threonine protein phosphatase PrpC
MVDLTSPPVTSLRLEIAGRTDPGQLREHNEDCLGNRVERYESRLVVHGWLFAVADGMGGHALGEVASQLAIDTLFDIYYHAEPDPALALREAIEAANVTVHYNATMRGVTMGTTLTVVVLRDEMLTVANVGDSRVYRLRDGRVQQLTQDHSLIAEQVRRGLMTAEQATQSQLGNVITRCIGYRSSVEVDISESPLRAGDVILLSSDGLHGLLETDEIASIVTDESLDDAAQMLVDVANLRGGPDNITCLLVRVLALPEARSSDGSAPDASASEYAVDDQPAADSQAGEHGVAGVAAVSDAASR